jgi:signal transduction histidine kinase
MACVSIDSLRKLVALPDWPLISGLALAAAAVLETIVYTGGVDSSNDSVSVVVNVLATAPLVARRTRLPVVATVVTVATLYAIASDSTPTVSMLVAQACVLYLVAERSRRWVSALLALPFVFTAFDPTSGAYGAIMLVAAIAALALGDSRRLTAERDEALDDQAAMGERARIARELHDVVAHHISMIVVQADTARLATPGMPAEGQEKLLAIRATARDAMDELRRVLGVLRDDADAAVEHEPQPGLDRLDELLDSAREAGTPVRLILQGHAQPLAAGVDLTAYRIVQEALTNARKHAPGAAVDVDLRYEDNLLHLRVRDAGPGPSGVAGGHGLLGMRERAATVGGVVRSGAAEGGGFVVEAELPVA